jgi:hypothetical protein
MSCCVVGLAVPDTSKDCSAQWSLETLGTISPVTVSHPRRHEFSTQGYLVHIKLITPFLVHCQQIFQHPPSPSPPMPRKNFESTSTTMSHQSSVTSGYGKEQRRSNPGMPQSHPAAKPGLQPIVSSPVDTTDSFPGVEL